MNNLTTKIKSYFNKGQARTRLAKKNIALLFVIKILNVLLSFILVTISIRFLGIESYGIWTVLSGFVMWANMFDFGFTHGLRNKLAELSVREKIRNAKYLVSSTYAFLIVISFILFILFTILIYYIEWSHLLNTNIIKESDLKLLMFIIMSMFLVQFTLKPLNAILESLQWPSIVHAITLLSNIIILIVIYFISHKEIHDKLIVYAIVFFGSSIVVMSIASLYFYIKKFRIYKPNIKYINKTSIKDISFLGMSFFILQICVIIISQTDNLIISYLFGPTQVTNYTIVYKYFSLVIVFFNILVTPFWSAVTNAYSLKDYKWIENAINKLLKVLLLSSFIAVFMFIISDYVYKLWISPEIKIFWGLSLLMAVYTVLFNLTTIYSFFISGVGKLRVSLYTNVFAAIFNIPLSFYFAKTLEMGLSGVLLGTITTIAFTGIFLYIQYKKIMTKTAYGIWDK